TGGRIVSLTFAAFFGDQVEASRSRGRCAGDVPVAGGKTPAAPTTPYNDVAQLDQGAQAQHHGLLRPSRFPVDGGQSGKCNQRSAFVEVPPVEVIVQTPGNGLGARRNVARGHDPRKPAATRNPEILRLLLRTIACNSIGGGVHLLLVRFSCAAP